MEATYTCFLLHAVLKVKIIFFNLNWSCSLQWNCFSAGKLKAIVKIFKTFSKFLILKGKAGSWNAALLKYILKSSQISSLPMSVEYALEKRLSLWHLETPVALWSERVRCGFRCGLAFCLNPAINHKCQCLSRAQRIELCNLQWLVILCTCNYIITQSCLMYILANGLFPNWYDIFLPASPRKTVLMLFFNMWLSRGSEMHLQSAFINYKNWCWASWTKELCEKSRLVEWRLGLQFFWSVFSCWWPFSLLFWQGKPRKTRW